MLEKLLLDERKLRTMTLPGMTPLGKGLACERLWARPLPTGLGLKECCGPGLVDPSPARGTEGTWMEQDITDEGCSDAVDVLVRCGA